MIILLYYKITKPPKVAQMNNSANIVVFSDCYHNDPAPLERMAARLDKYQKLPSTTMHGYNHGYNVLYRGCLYGFYIKYEFPKVGDPRLGNPVELWKLLS